MNIVKNYAKSFLKVVSISEAKSIVDRLIDIKDVFNSKKYKLVISSPIISDEEKMEFIKNIVSIDNDKFLNLLKVLTENNRLVLLPEIIDELHDEVAIATRQLDGYVLTNEDLDVNTISEIERKLSDALYASVSLEKRISSEIEGIKVYVNTINLEASVYKNVIDNKLIEYILEAI